MEFLGLADNLGHQRGWFSRPTRRPKKGKVSKDMVVLVLNLEYTEVTAYSNGSQQIKICMPARILVDAQLLQLLCG